jgi:hypothetical protein
MLLPFSGYKICFPKVAITPTYAIFDRICDITYVISAKIYAS